MHTSLKNVTERAQKYDFSVNIPIYIDILCQKVDHHCVFPLNIDILCSLKVDIKRMIVFST